MYSKRLKIFVGLCAFFAVICLARLAYMQLGLSSAWHRRVEEFRTGTRKQLPTLRGRILDRNGRVLAGDEAKFTLSMDYSIAQLADDRFWLDHNRDDYADELKRLQEIIFKLAQFKAVTVNEITERIAKEINNPLWNMRLYLAWKRKYPDRNFEEIYADKRMAMALKVDLAEMHRSHALLSLRKDDDVLAAQLAFINIDGIQIAPGVVRVYPYGSVASQLIGWVRPFDPKDLELFDEDDELQRYQPGDTAGFCGVEYICETILRGRRGKVVYNLDKELIRRTKRNFGEDVGLTIDIELQKKIENILTDRNVNNNWDNPMAVVVIDVNSADVLALVSLPGFDLNTARSEYAKLAANPNHPLINKTINKHYPPGSTAKPIILVAAMEEGKITANEVISCPAHKPKKGWPRCWYERKYGSHDDQWSYDGGNKARNAIKGSCNIFFSRLANRLNPDILQRWLYNFGYGREILQLPRSMRNGGRGLRQTPGIISSTIPSKSQIQSERFPPISKGELRYFGLGQGNFRATPLQIANAVATIARGGVYKSPEIFTADTDDELRDMKLGKNTLATVRDGMAAVVGEQGGTAYRQFVNSGFSSKGVTVYGKTGSTQGSENALFAGFAEDKRGRSIAIAIVVEGGQHGSSDAAPLARDIISLCIEAGYIGNR